MESHVYVISITSTRARLGPPFFINPVETNSSRLVVKLPATVIASRTLYRDEIPISSIKVRARFGIVPEILEREWIVDPFLPEAELVKEINTRLETLMDSNALQRETGFSTRKLT